MSQHRRRRPRRSPTTQSPQPRPELDTKSTGSLTSSPDTEITIVEEHSGHEDPPQPSSNPERQRGPRLQHHAKEGQRHSGLLRSRSLLVITIFLTFCALGALSYALWPSSSTPPSSTDLEANEVSEQQSPTIDPAPALELFIPSAGVHASFDEGPCRVKNGAIDPATMTNACTYTAADKPYSLPGTNAKDLVVIAGHTGAGVPAVFDNLYDGAKNQHRVSVGDKLYLRTASSGSTWLVYAATDLHNPDKEGLASDASIWGTDPEPGRLLTISCIQPANPLQPAVKNAVVGWRLQGTSQTTEVAAE